MRLFVAVFPPPEALEHLAVTVAQLNLTRRIIPPDRWHITLAFLGEVPLALPAPPDAPAPGGPLGGPAPGGPLGGPAPGGPRSAPTFAAADDYGAQDGGEGAVGGVGWRGGRGARGGVSARAVWGAFGRVRVPVGEVRLASGGRFGQVVWAGVEGDASGLTRLARAVRRELRAVRVPSDDKKFRPHLTIARSAAGLSNEDMVKLKAYQGPGWLVSELVLVRSELGPHPQYSRLGAWPVPSDPG